MDWNLFWTALSSIAAILAVVIAAIQTEPIFSLIKELINASKIKWKDFTSERTNNDKETDLTNNDERDKVIIKPTVNPILYDFNVVCDPPTKKGFFSLFKEVNLYIEGSYSSINSIDKVTYFLPKEFNTPRVNLYLSSTAIVNNPKNGLKRAFRLNLTSFGKFMVYVVITTKDGQERKRQILVDIDSFLPLTKPKSDLFD